MGYRLQHWTVAFTLGLLLFVYTLHLHAAPLLLNPEKNGQSATGYLSYLLDQNGQLGIQEITGSTFQPLEGEARLGFTDATLWLALDLQQQSTLPQEWWLEVVFASLDEVHLYTQTAEGHWQQQTLGDLQPFAQRPIEYRNFIFPFQLNNNQLQRIYLQIRTQDSLVAPIRIWSVKQFQRWHLMENLLLGLSFGIMLAMFIYNAILWWVLRDRLYGYYLMAAATAILTITELNGYAFQYFWPNSIWLANYQHVLVPAAYFVALTAWGRMFLNTAQRTPRLDIGLRLVNLFAALMLLSVVVGEYRLGNIMSFVVGLYTMILFSWVSIKVALTQFLPAKLFMAAQLFPLIGAALTVSRASGLVPNNLLTEHGFQLGVTIEVLLFSLALAQRIKLLKSEKKAAQKRAETDPLTGLYNRAGLFHHSKKRLNRPPHKVAVLLIDLDHFKPINDQMGHAVGDQVLVTVAERILAQTSLGIDVVGRLGGDEFVVVLDQSADERATATAEQIRKALAYPIVTTEGETHIGASIGIACSTDASSTLEALIKQADALMYQAKRARHQSHASSY
ncbi:diguanylate cyclase (GGDEF) domain-containing protein [Oceanospirillum multiglobuliferum]|uniref:GGDEF domain-containing protein n=1 Tax=Oceanospirillum multiglobuliferum TaxID=64969 RepID=A0A1T4LZI6_9GAMM|nr:diguanylate cyclase [Oceanospirillum multiglobuliferum]OPX56306.1 hypothetical protein BTE48_04860 [Oceanospirillum multiglobuliferum]SJZ59874.1 diguanylate cyclase (GGDEF) domain-containing protein [Oceanospirillum multiglobuliferum]